MIEASVKSLSPRSREIEEQVFGERLRDGRARVVIENVAPAVDSGRFAVKRVVGDRIVVEADVFSDGHDAVSATLHFRHDAKGEWTIVPMRPLGNDRWSAEFTVEQLGRYVYRVAGWVDHFATWRRDLQKRIAAGQDIGVDLLIGAQLLDQAAASASSGSCREQLETFADRLREDSAESTSGVACQVIDDPELSQFLLECGPIHSEVTQSPEFPITVDRPKAAFSAWYEMFPRSAASHPEGTHRHGTLRDVEARLSYIAEMGFDVLYLPPIHPIGRAHRKGPNNAPTSHPDDVGSPWGIGSPEGGHKSIHSQLGTIDDFRHLLAAAEQHGIELALDIAFQASPDHPYVREHPEWFRNRPDGTIQYAENPPKKYQDIYPFDFECEDWQALWHELRGVFQFWIDEGVRIFRVDNPHTKPFPFWEWVINDIRRGYPDVIFLAEAFTRPKVMYCLAKLGFTQSYTYFAWRDTKWELTKYFTELTRSEVREFFRPNLWPNTPDILPESLQVGGRAAFMSRLVLAATLAGNYGIYGPPFEHGWSAPREPGSEEYLHSEKYQVHLHDIDRPDSLKDFIARVNRIRRGSPALAHRGTLEFHESENKQIICYSRAADDRSDIVLVIVSLDPHYRQSAWITLPLEAMELPANRPYQMHDLLTDARYLWHGERNYVELDPSTGPAHIFRIRRKARSERDFEYYL
jgi:starch synthase (maltosyl-transferring)